MKNEKFKMKNEKRKKVKGKNKEQIIMVIYIKEIKE
jgi:hypothetical protein